MALKANKIITLRPTAVQPYRCPLVKISFVGTCPNVHCPANISERRTNASGCFFEQHQPNIIGAARWLRLTTHEVKRRYKRGINKLEKFTNFYNWLHNYREVNRSKSCPNCGIHNPHGLICLNGKRCTKRLELFQLARQRFPFNVVPLNVTASEFWAVCANAELRESLLTKWLQRRSAKLSDKLK